MERFAKNSSFANTGLAVFYAHHTLDRLGNFCPSAVSQQFFRLLSRVSTSDAITLPVSVPTSGKKLIDRASMPRSFANPVFDPNRF